MTSGRLPARLARRTCSRTVESAATAAVRCDPAHGSAGSGISPAPGAADWLGLAAAPTFTIMALLTGVFGGGPPDVFCASAAPPLSGMVLMYLLMSAFHSAPWLKLVRGRRSSVRPY
jgi:hypothetical protein